MDYYEILQVSPRADIEVIRAAYRVLARAHHPDLGGNPRRMAAVNEAWATLRDPLLRRRYDARLRQAAAIAMTTATRPAAQEPVGVMRRDRATAPDRPTTDRPTTDRPTTERPTTQRPTGGAPARPAQEPGVLDFGRYAGWSLAELSRHDPDYLLWLERTPIGRPIRAAIQQALERRPGGTPDRAGPAIASARRQTGWFR